MEKIKSMKVKESTHKKLLLETSKRQLALGRRVPFDELIQNFLRKGTINLNVPENTAEKLKREIKRKYGTESLEEGITKILEDWVKERKKK